MMKRGEVGLADLALVLKTLAIHSDDELRAVGKSLGLGGLRRSDVPALRGGSEHRLKHRHAERPARPEQRARVQPPPLPSQPERPAQALTTDWSRAPPLPPADTPSPSAAPQQLRLDANSRPVPRAALFPRRTASGVLSAAAATRRPGRNLDLPELIQRIVQYQRLQPLPVLPSTTLVHGVQLVLDRGPSMAPFRPDQQDLVRACATVVGATSLEVLDFSGDPNAATRFSAARELPWKPRRGRPVVVVTDLGLGASDALGENVSALAWRRMVRNLTRMGCPTVFLVPVPRGDWPRWLNRMFNPLHWDPRTRAETVRATIGFGHVLAP